MSRRQRGSRAAAHIFGVPIDSVMARRESLADNYDIEFGAERVFPELLEAVLSEIPEGAAVLEVGAATGLVTRPLLGRAGALTALEPSPGMLRRLLASDATESPHLRVVQGMVEDLSPEMAYDLAVVTFTPRRGLGLLKLMIELAIRVRSRVVMMLAEDGSMDWAYLSRSASAQGFDVRVRIVRGAEGRRAVVLVADVADWVPTLDGGKGWGVDARETAVPTPPPRGAATRILRFFMASGDRALLVRADRADLDRLYGNLRTAAHRLGEGEVTIRREHDGVLILRLPKHGDV